MPFAAKLFRSMGGAQLFAVTAALLWLPLSIGAFAQSSEVAQTVSATAFAAVIPQQVRYTGALSTRGGETVEAVFKIYATAEGGEALWTETQRVFVGADGSYSVLLGAASQSGLPQAVFVAGQGRWVGVTIDRAEGVRSPLASVAYAMKAGDAESVGGVSAANLVTKDELAKLTQTGATAAQAQTLVQAQPTDSPTGSGMPDYVPLWTAAGTLGDSNLFQASSGFMGIGTTTPGGPLELATGATGGANATMMLEQTSAASGNYYADIGLYNTHGLIGNLSALGAGYTPGNLWGANDVVFLGGQQYAATNVIMMTNTGGALKFGTGGYGKTDERLRIGKTGGISIGNGYVATDPGPGNLIVSGNVGIGTTTPGAVLEVNGTAKFDGLVTFDTGQTFPGTITGITATSPLTGGGTSGAVTVGLDTDTLATTLESTFDARYAELAASSTAFAGSLTAYQNGGSTFSAVSGNGSAGSVGVFGDSDSGTGVRGVTTSGPAGVLGSGGSGSSSAYATLFPGILAGAWGDTTGASGTYQAGVVATTDNGFGAIVITNSSEDEGLSVENTQGQGATIRSDIGGPGLDVLAKDGDGIIVNSYGTGFGVLAMTEGGVKGTAGVAGINSIYSGTGVNYNVYGGIWGDTGTDSAYTGSAMATGVYGTSDNGRAAIFLNDSSAYPTILVKNYGSGATGNVVNGLFNTLMATSAGGTCGIGGGSMSCTGPIKSLASAGGGSRTIETYATQSAENWMEDYGSGAMEHGVGVVQLDSSFAETVTADASYHVFLTPRGDSKGLYVTNVTASSFEVRESSGGTSSIGFDYKIVGKRRGYEAQRLTDVSETFTREMAGATPLKVEGPRKVMPVMKPSILERVRSMPHRAIAPSPTPRKVLPRAAAAPTPKAAS